MMNIEDIAARNIAIAQQRKLEADNAQELIPTQGDMTYFALDLESYTFKEDMAGMELPLFALRGDDHSVFSWTSVDGDRFVEVAPSTRGRATQHDKDFLIFVISQMVRAMEDGRQDTRNQYCRFRVYDYLKATGRGTSGQDYIDVETALVRLQGTSIRTNVKAGRRRIKKWFSLIAEVEVVERTGKNDQGWPTSVQFRISDWLYSSVVERHVLAINPAYFRIRSPIDRRLYELARKHCGKQEGYELAFDTLFAKLGSTDTSRKFKWRLLKGIKIPDYTVAYDAGTDKVVFAPVDKS